MYLLSEKQYELALPPLKDVPINTLFAQSVALKKAPGIIYVDNRHAPRSFYIRHHYGMSLVYGEHKNKDFNHWLKQYFLSADRPAPDFLQACPQYWQAGMNQLLAQYWTEADDLPGPQFSRLAAKNKFLRCKRLTFEFVPQHYQQLKSSCQQEPEVIIPTTKEIFNHQQGSVLVRHFWHDADDFIQNGMGFSVIRNNREASTAFSSCLIGQDLEIGIETAEHFRGMGLALRACMAVIDDALEKGRTLHWACRDGNTGSRKLAEKLGFRINSRHDYFCVL